MFGRRFRFGRGGSVLAWAVWLALRSPEASAAPLELEWNAPAGCPGAQQVLDAIQRLIGAQGAEGAAQLSVRGDVVARGQTLVLKLVWRTGNAQAERLMESSNCDELVRAAALVVALAADPSAPRDVGESSESEAASEAPSTRPLVPPRRPPRSAPKRSPVNSAPAPLSTTDAGDPTTRDSAAEEQQAGAARQARRPAVRAQFALDAGSLPRAAEGVALSATSPLGPVLAQAELAMFIPQRKTVPEGAADLWLGALSLRPCLPWSLARLRLQPCAVAEMDLLVGQGQSVDFRQGGAAWFPRFGVGIEFGYRLSQAIAWVADAWLLAGPWRPTFVLDEIPVHEPNLLAGRWTTGLELRL